MLRLAWAAFAALVLAWVVVMSVSITLASPGMMGVGTMMSPTNGAGGTPGGGFAILTESNQPLATEASAILVTQAHP